MRRHVVIGSVFALMVGASLALAAPSNDTTECFEKRFSNPDAAVAACTRLIRSGRIKSPNLEQVYLWRMEAHAYAQRHDAAITDASHLVEKLIRHDPQKFTNWQAREAYYGRGASYLAKREYARAISDLSIVVRNFPSHYNALYLRANAYLAAGDADKAIADFTEVIRLQPTLTSAFEKRARAYEGKLDFPAALADARNAIEATRSMGGSGTASQQEYVKRLEEKVAASTSVKPAPPAAAAKPDGAEQCDFGAAPEILIDACTKILAAPSQTAEDRFLAHALRAHAYRSKGEAERAAADYRAGLDVVNSFIAAEPREVRPLYGRAELHTLMGEYARALADFDEIARRGPTDSLFHEMRASVYEKMGDFSRAAADLEIVMQRNPSEKTSTALARVRKAIAEAPPPAAPAQQASAPAAPRTPEPAAQAAGAPPSVAAVPPSSVVAAAPAATPAVTPMPSGSRVALVVGNGQYLHATKLTNPANDAADIAAALRKLGFDVIEGIDLDKRGMEEKVRAFGRKLDRAELALFYYAGHGLQVAGKNYLVPVDAKLERPGDLNFDTMDVGFILAQMEADQRVNLVFLDACRDNPLARTFARALGTRSAAVGQGLATIQGALGTMVTYATHPDAVALDGDGRNSPFTAAMIKHLATPGLEIATLMRRVRSDVVAATRGKQIPWDHSSLMGEVVLAR